MTQRIQARLTKLELLNNLYASISEHGDSLQDTFKVISKIIQENLKSHYLDFVLLDKDNPEKANIYSISRNGEIKESYTNIVGISKYSIQSKEKTIEENVTKNIHYEEWRKNIKSEICLPVFHKKKVIGCINLEFTNQRKFDNDTITTLEIITSAIGTIIYTTSLNEKIKESENKFRNIVENMTEGLWLGDEKHKTLYVNPSFQTMTGLTYDECLQKDCFGYYDEESVEKIKHQHELAGPERTDPYRFINKNKEEIPVVCSGTPIPGGTVGIFTDLRSLEEKEKQLTQITKLEKMLANISDSSIDAIFSMDKNLIIQTWNKGAVKMFGYSKEEAVGQNIKILYPPERLQQGELEYLVKTTLEKGFVRNYETVRVNKGGKDLNTSISVTKLTDERDRFIGFSGIYRDISYQKKAEKELQLRFESMQNAYMELGRQRRELDYLLDALNIAIGDEQFQNIENYIVNAAMMLTKANGATLRIYDEKDKYLHLKAGNGIQPEWWGKSKIQFHGSLIEDAFNTRQPLFVDDIQNNPRYSSPKLASEHGFVSSLIIPLYVKSKIIGDLSLYSSSKNKLNLLDNAFISNFGKQASLAIFTQTQLEK